MKDKKWHELAPTPAKGERIPMTEEHFYKVLAMHEELIQEQRIEIGKLHMTVAKQQAKLGSKRKGEET